MRHVYTSEGYSESWRHDIRLRGAIFGAIIIGGRKLKGDSTFFLQSKGHSIGIRTQCVSVELHVPCETTYDHVCVKVDVIDKWHTNGKVMQNMGGNSTN
jgi:hypothetical protein